MKKWVALSLVAISLAFVAVLCGSESAFADDILKPIWDQTYSTKFDDLKITNTVKGADVLLDKTKVHFYNACAGGEAGFNNNQYGIKFNGDMANYFYCQLHKHSEGKKWRLWKEDDETSSGDYYTVATYSTVFGDDGPKVIGPISGSIEILSKGAVTDAKTGDVYDLYFKITNVRMKSADCTGDYPNTMAAILMGMGTQVIGGANNPPVGTSMFTARAFQDHWICDVGALYDVEVRVRDPNTKQFLNKSMLWAFNDVDIADIVSDSPAFHTYDSEHPYAEHVTFKNGLLTGSNGYNISMVEASDSSHYRELYPYAANQNSSTVYHRFYEEGDANHVYYGDGSVRDNSASFLVRASTGGDGFKFEWGGSTCGSYIDDAPASRYSGMTTLNYNGTNIVDGGLCVTNNPSSGIDYTCTVNGKTSKNISFQHKLRYEAITSDNDLREPFFVEYSHAGSSSERPGVGNNDTVVLSAGGQWTSASTKNIGSVNLTPGQKKTYSETLRYRYSNINDTRSSFASAGPHTVTVKRPLAQFTASIKTTVKNGSTNATIGSSKKVKITDPDGKYSVSFGYTVKRKNDTAGDTVGSQWNTELKKDGYIPSPSHEASGTASLAEGASTSATGQSYEGNLRYGESITFCGDIQYKSIIDATNGDSTATASDCVTVWRDNATCDFFPSFQYGLNNASNVGRIGVNNFTVVGNQDNPTFTVPYTDPDVSVFARPGDSVRFYLQMCAGTLYPIREKGLSRTITYTATGESSKQKDAGNGYLFRQSVSVVDGTFYNPRSWNSFADGHNYNFLRNKNVIGDFWSPNGQAEKKYHCGAVADMENGHYQIAGKTNCGRSDNPAYDIGIIDVGSTITQKLEWDEMTYTNGNFDGSKNPHRIVTASVITPYNYVLKPYVNNGSNKVAYLGESVKMTPGVVVGTRKNTAFPSGKQTYATITKPTDINVKYYFASASGTVITEAAVPNSSRTGTRLNTNGINGGTGLSDVYSTTIESGGTLLPDVEVPIPEGIVHVGDKVCVEVSVYPADSHDTPNAASVSGKGNNDIALQETSNGTNWVTAVSCSTIAKKPSMSVESSNAYSATQFKTAQYARNNGGTMFNFGSWSEYGVFGRINTGASIFASGAALGYSRDGYSTSRTANISRANDAASAEGKKVPTKTNSDKCTFMTQTFANVECNPGYSKIGGVMATQYEQRIKDRYATDTGTFNAVGLSAKTYDDTPHINVSGYSGSDVIVEPSGIIRFDSKNNLYIASLPNISDAQFAEKGITKPNRTIVYSAPKKSIVIDGNLNADDGTKGTIDELTQVIIIAKNVYFTDAVTYTNAIIIAENLNTCKYASGAKVAIGGKSGASTINSNMCNQTLRFDSPVVVKKLILNRTAGADNGENAIRRAEIFNLNMANYLWSFNQMSRLSQATTTYSRELPTRY